jgi:hypothetical protein
MPTETSTNRPFSTSASHIMSSSLNQNLIYANRLFQQQQTSQGPSTTQLILPIAMWPTDIQYERLYLPYQVGWFLHHQQPSLPHQDVREPIVPAADSAPQCPTQPTPLPPASVPLASREQQEVHVAPSRVSNSTWLVKSHITGIDGEPSTFRLT